MKTIATTLLVMFLVGCAVEVPPVAIIVPEPKHYDTRVVVLKADTATGTGLLFGDKVLTCNHCVMDKMKVIYADGRKGKVVKVLKRDAVNDLALLEVTNSKGGMPFDIGLDPAPGTPVYSIGHPLGRQYVYTDGEVAIANITRGSPKRTILKMSVNFGCSGSPVFTKGDNELIGIVQSMFPASDYCVVVPAPVIVTFLFVK